MQGVLLAGVLGSQGCFSTAHRQERYLAANGDRPAAVVQALRDGDRLVAGMTPQEVRLIMGPPARTETVGTNAEALWHYDLQERRDNSLLSSDMWTLPIPFRTVVFGAGNTVTEIINYDDNTADDLTVPEPVAIPESRSPRPPAPPVAVTIPAYRPNPDEINVYGWPAITLQGLTGSGSARNAVINGRVLEPGDRVGEVALDAVYANGVVIELHGRRAFLRPGESTGSRTETQ